MTVMVLLKVFIWELGSVPSDVSNFPSEVLSATDFAQYSLFWDWNKSGYNSPMGMDNLEAITNSETQRTIKTHFWLVYYVEKKTNQIQDS